MSDPEQPELKLSELLRRRLQEEKSKSPPREQKQISPDAQKDLDKISSGIKGVLKDMLGDPQAALIAMRYALDLLQREGLTSAWTDVNYALRQNFPRLVRKIPEEQQISYIEKMLRGLVNQFGPDVARHVLIEELNFYIEINSSIYMPKEQHHEYKPATLAYRRALFVDAPWVQKTEAEKAELLKEIEDSL